MPLSNIALWTEIILNHVEVWGLHPYNTHVLVQPTFDSGMQMDHIFSGPEVCYNLFYDEKSCAQATVYNLGEVVAASDSSPPLDWKFLENLV